jgi:molybdopterin synthase catalytic subunit
MSQPWIQLVPTPLDSSRAIAYVSDVEEAGGVCVFLGTTRAEQNQAGQELLALDYEAYPEMALKQMQQLAETAQQRWPAPRVVILHRLGRVPISEASVLIAVASPHRAEAFEACRWIIDTLKKDVAIWKKEVWADGSGTWVHPA